MAARPVYMDYQAATPADPKVVEAMLPFFSERFGNPHSDEHSTGWDAATAVEAAAADLAAWLGVASEELVFTSGATESNNAALAGLFRHRGRSPLRKRLLISAIEHKSVLGCAEYLERAYGAVVEIVPVDAQGLVDLSWLRTRISEDVLAISVMAVNNEIGTIQPYEQIADIARSCGAAFHCDATQAPCALDLAELTRSVDLLSLSAHKMYGPKGIGLLYVRGGLHLEPLFHGGSQQGGMRPGTVPVPLCVGFAAASKILTAGMQSEHGRLSRLRDTLWSALSAGLQGLVTLNGPPLGSRHPGNLNVRIAGADSEDLIARLQPTISLSSGAACNGGLAEPSQVLRAIGLSRDDARSSLRLSVGRFTTDMEVNCAAAAIVTAVNGARSISFSAV